MAREAYLLGLNGRGTLRALVLLGVGFVVVVEMDEDEDDGWSGWGLIWLEFKQFQFVILLR
jgi:hypothetical protein